MLDISSYERGLDYIFSNLGVTGERVNNPVWLTEPLCNPSGCRAEINELLFELYNVPSVGYSVDNLCSYFHNMSETKTNNADNLIDTNYGISIQFGLYSSTVVPILSGKPYLKNSFRIPVGGFQCLSATLQRLHLESPSLRYRGLFSLQQLQELCWLNCYVPDDYLSELK
eukprot:UN33049